MCKCTSSPVSVSLKGDVSFNHVCGCSKCWKPEGSVFAQIAVLGRDNVKVTANEQKLTAACDRIERLLSTLKVMV